MDFPDGIKVTDQLTLKYGDDSEFLRWAQFILRGPKEERSFPLLRGKRKGGREFRES